MTLGRRELGGGLAAAILASLGGGAARAAPSTAPDVVVYCDRALRTPLESVGRLFAARIGGAPAHVFCAPPPLMLAQIERITQNDVLITGSKTMDEAAARRLIRPETRVALGANRLIVASLAGAVPRPVDRAGIGPLIGTDPLAAPDRTTGSTVDSAGVLRRLGFIPPLGFSLVGAIDTEEVAWLIRTRAVKLGLLYRTEACPGSGLAVAAELPGEAPVPYAAAISVVTRSPRAEAFMAFLRSSEAAASLRANGLEIGV